MNSFQSSARVAEAMSLMEYHQAIGGNPPLNNLWTSDLMFERFKECTGQMHGYDLISTQNQDYGPLVMPVAQGLGSGCDALLFEMLAGSHGQHLAELNYGNLSSEVRFGLTTASGVSYTPRSDIPKERDSFVSSADTCAQGFADATNFIGYYPTPTEAMDGDFTQARSGLNTSSIPVALQLQQQSLEHEETAPSPVSNLPGADHGILQAQYEDFEQTAVAEFLEDHVHVPLASVVPELDGAYRENGSGQGERSLEPTNGPFPKVLVSPSSDALSKFSSSSSLPDQRAAPDPVYRNPQATSGPSSSRRARARRALKRPHCFQASSVDVQRPRSSTQKKPLTHDHELCEGPPLSFADSTEALALDTKTNFGEMADDDVLGETTDRHMSPKRRQTRLLGVDREAELQRMTHIAVERNRRRQMNDNLAALKALMPVAYVHKSDQASVIGAAVEFVKELQVLLESLQSTKRRRSYADILAQGRRKSSDPGLPHSSQLLATSIGATAASPILICPTASEDLEAPRQAPVPPLKPVTMTSASGLLRIPALPGPSAAELKAECTSTAATVEVKVMGNDAVVNVITHWRPRQLVKVIGALEGLYMTIMHISITTTKGTVLYTFTTQMRPECRMTADQIAAALQQTFKLLHYTKGHALTAGAGMRNRRKA